MALEEAAGWAKRRAEAAVTRRLTGLEAAVAAEFPDVAVERDEGRLVLRAPGLAVRARGRRGRGPDPRLAMLAAWLSAGGN